MSEAHGNGELNPGFDMNEVDTKGKEEPEIQITRFGGKEDDETVKGNVTLVIDGENDNEVKETVSDILKRSQNRDSEIKDTKDTRISIPENKYTGLHETEVLFFPYF
jgi:hypothetical protein